MKRKKRPPKVEAYFLNPRDLKAVRAAAARAKLSMSAYLVRSAVDNANGDDMTARLLEAPAFRGAIADMMGRPAVIAELADRLKVSSPAQLDLFKREVARGLGITGRARG